MCPATSKKEEIPSNFIIQLWRRLDLAVPVICVPGTDFRISITLLGSVCFMAWRYFWKTSILMGQYGWPEDAANRGAGNVISATHSTLLCPALAAAFWCYKYSPSEPLNLAPLWYRQHVDAMLQFCTAYMVFDAFFLLVPIGFNFMLLGENWLFMIHHMMTTTYMTQARVYKAGHMSAMMCMFLGELSNPLHNGFMFLEEAMKLDCCSGETTAKVFYYVSIAFAVVYLLLRVIIGPIVCAHMSYDLLFSKHAKENLPLAIRIFWNLMIWGVIFGSYSWIVYCKEILDAKLHGKVSGEGEL